MAEFKIGGGNKPQLYNPDGTYGTTEKSRQERFERAQELYGYDKNQYNHYGWARGNEILTADKNSEFRSKFTKVMSGLETFHKNPNGEYMIDVGERHGAFEGVNNVVVYAKGIAEIPTITKVVKIDLDNETDLTIARGELKYYEQMLCNDRARIPEALGELFTFYDSIDFEV